MIKPHLLVERRLSLAISEQQTSTSYLRVQAEGVHNHKLAWGSSHQSRDTEHIRTADTRRFPYLIPTDTPLFK